jgi:hypothetical protein
MRVPLPVPVRLLKWKLLLHLRLRESLSYLQWRLLRYHDPR